jgi:hypothetical protein
MTLDEYWMLICLNCFVLWLQGQGGSVPPRQVGSRGCRGKQAVQWRAPAYRCGCSHGSIHRRASLSLGHRRLPGELTKLLHSALNQNKRSLAMSSFRQQSAMYKMLACHILSGELKNKQTNIIDAAWKKIWPKPVPMECSECSAES